jgi:hypothetical protein
MEIISYEFNNTCEMFLDLIYSFTNDSDISFYKKAMKKIINMDINKIIEQFIIHCYIYKDHVDSKNINHFLNLNLKNKYEKESLLGVIKIKEIFNTFDQDQNNLIFEYLILLCNFSTEYLKIKFT